MSSELLLKSIYKILDEKQIKLNEPMSRHTTFRAGGNARVLLLPSNIDELTTVLKLVMESGISYVVTGNGSNILVKDSGYDGVILKTCYVNNLEVKGNYIISECGVMLPALSRFAMQNRLSGAEFLFGIPGTVGGAVAMNAGAYNTEIKDILLKVTIFNEAGGVIEVGSEELMLEYRKSILPYNGWTLLSAEFVLKQGSKDNINTKMLELQAKRIASQPLNLPNAGSIFKAVNGKSAGILIEEAGLKNLSLGGAAVSDKHANFIVNRGNATASDIIGLIERIKEVVKLKQNVELETEIKFIG